MRRSRTRAIGNRMVCWSVTPWALSPGRLQQLRALLLFEELDQPSDVLRAVAWDDEQRIGRIDDDQIRNANGRHELFGAVHEITGGVDGLAGTCKHVLGGRLGEKFVNGGPGADVAPADFRGNDEYTCILDGGCRVGRAGFRCWTRGGFENRVIH